MSDITGSKRIGNLNGNWSVLLRVALATYPPLVVAGIGWATWMTKNQFADNAFRESRETFTQSDALRLKSEVFERIDTKNAILQEIRDRLVRIETTLQLHNKENH